MLCRKTQMIRPQSTELTVSRQKAGSEATLTLFTRFSSQRAASRTYHRHPATGGHGRYCWVAEQITPAWLWPSGQSPNYVHLLISKIRVTANHNVRMQFMFRSHRNTKWYSDSHTESLPDIYNWISKREVKFKVSKNKNLDFFYIPFLL